MIRATASCEALAPVEIKSLVDWIEAVAFKDMPQRHNLGEGKAVIVDPLWMDFYKRTDGIVDQLMWHFPLCTDEARMLVVVMPGASIKPHKDPQAEHWRARVHVPLVSNGESGFIIENEVHNMKPGTAYCVNPELQHSVINNGITRRIHFIFDVVE